MGTGALLRSLMHPGRSAPAARGVVYRAHCSPNFPCQMAGSSTGPSLLQNDNGQRRKGKEFSPHEPYRIAPYRPHPELPRALITVIAARTIRAISRF